MDADDLDALRIGFHHQVLYGRDIHRGHNHSRIESDGLVQRRRPTLGGALAVDDGNIPLDGLRRLLNLIAPLMREGVLGVGWDIDDFRAGRRLRSVGRTEPLGLWTRPLFGRFDRV